MGCCLSYHAPECLSYCEPDYPRAGIALLGQPVKHCNLREGHYLNLDDESSFTPTDNKRVMNIKKEPWIYKSSHGPVKIPLESVSVLVDEDFGKKTTCVIVKGEDESELFNSGRVGLSIDVGEDQIDAKLEAGLNFAKSKAPNPGKVHFTLSMPLLRIGLLAQADPGFEGRYINEVIFGGEATGTITLRSSHNTGARANVGSSVRPTGVHADVSAGFNTQQSLEEYECKLQSKSGPDIRMDFNNKSMAQIIHHMQRKWAEKLRNSPKFWKPLYVRASCSEPGTATKLNLLVVGEVGDGKSTLINAFLPEGTEGAKAGLAARGLTKEITAYHWIPILGLQPVLYDSPGVGDQDVTIPSLIAQIEERLKETCSDNKFNAVLVTTPLVDTRVKLGAQVVRALIDKGFVSGNKWDNIILVGTKSDLATEEQLDFFRNELVREFFPLAPEGPKNPLFAIANKKDYTDVVKCVLEIGKRPSHIEYKSPSAEQLSRLVAEKWGLKLKSFEKELEDARQREAAATERAKNAEMKAAQYAPYEPFIRAFLPPGSAPVVGPYKGNRKNMGAPKTVDLSLPRQLFRKGPDEALRPGSRVRVKGLQGAQHYNDRQAYCVKWLDENGRWRVKLEDGDHEKEVDIRPDNVEHLMGHFTVAVTLNTPSDLEELYSEGYNGTLLKSACTEAGMAIERLKSMADVEDFYFTENDGKLTRKKEDLSFPVEAKITLILPPPLQSVSTSDALRNKTRLGLYFGGKWCPHCPPFSTRLKEFYATYTKSDPEFEVIYISSQRDSRCTAEQYFLKEHGDWLMMSCDDAAKVFQDLMCEFNLNCIPSFVIINKDGTFITEYGREIVQELPPHDVVQDKMFYDLPLGQEVELSKIGKKRSHLASLKHQRFTVRGFDQDGDPYVNLEDANGALQRHYIQPVKGASEEVSIEVLISSKDEAETELKAAIDKAQLSDGILADYMVVTDATKKTQKLGPGDMIPESMRYPVSAKLVLEKPKSCTS